MNKKGDEKYYIIISLILGIMILALSLYFIFQEYFSEDEIDMEVCRQSIYLREGVGSTVTTKAFLQDQFPIKCKTGVVEIDYKDYKKASKQIMDTMVFCWALYGGGKADLYPGTTIQSGYDVNCFHCARIRFSPEVVDYYTPKNYQVSKLIREIDKGVREEVFSGKKGFYISDYPKHKPIIGYDSYSSAPAESEYYKKLPPLINIVYKEGWKIYDFNNKDEPFSSINGRRDPNGVLEKLEGSSFQEGYEFLIKLKVEGNDQNNQKNLIGFFELASVKSPEISKKEKEESSEIYNALFDWRFYLNEQADENGNTYAEYLGINVPEDKFIDDFAWKGIPPLNNIENPGLIDASKGDLFITLTQINSKNFLTNDAYSWQIIPNQQYQNLRCDLIETIPA